MSRAGRLAVLLPGLALLLGSGSARADNPVEAAAALQQQVRAWMADLAGPSVDFGSHAVQVTPEGAGYRFELPLAGPVGEQGWRIAADPATAMVRPLDGGRWAIDSLHLPSPVKVEQPAAAGAAQRSWTLQVAEQEIHGTFDPTLATGSSWDMAFGGYSSVGHSEKGTESNTLFHYASHGGWEPAGDGRVNAAGEARGENLVVAIESAQPTRRRITVNVASTHGDWRLDRVAFDRLGAAVRSIGGLLPTAMLATGSASAPHSLAPADRAGLRNLVLALGDVVGGVHQNGTLEKLRVEAAGASGTIDSITIGTDAAAKDGLLDASLRLAMEGIDSSLIPDGPLRDYVPRRLALTPYISGVPASDLMALLLRAIDSDHPETLLVEAMALLGKGPLKAGLDDVVLDLGTAVLKASATVTVVAPADATGSAHIVATGLDGLIRRAASVPALQKSAPMLIFLKGIGQQDGDTTTWDVTYAGGHAKVNGTDFSALMPGRPDRPRSPRPRPRQP